MSTEGGNLFELEVSNCLLSMKWHVLLLCQDSSSWLPHLVGRGRKKASLARWVLHLPQDFLHVIARMPLSNL